MSIEVLQAHYGFSRMPFGRDLAPQMLHRSAGHGEAVDRALASGRPLRESGVPAELLDPAGYLGSADALVDRALALYRS